MGKKKKVRTDKIRGIARGVKEWFINGSEHWSGKLFTSEKRRKIRKGVNRDEREVMHSKGTVGI